MEHADHASIVLSSTWRLDSALLHALERVFDKQGLTIYDHTPDLEKTSTGDRVDEILMWLREHRQPITPGSNDTIKVAWVAIDDLDLLRMNPKLDPDHFVRTRDANGLTRACAEEVLVKLQRTRAAPATTAAQQHVDALERATALSPTEARLEPWLGAMVAIIEREVAPWDEPELPVALTESLLLADADAAADLDRLVSLGVTHVLNMAGEAGSVFGAGAAAAYREVGIEYRCVEAKDDLLYRILDDARGASAFLRLAAAGGARSGVALVHCQAGINRSTFAALAHLMLEGRRPLLDALELCKQARGVVLLNRSFVVQALRLASDEGLLGEEPAGAAPACAPA